MALSNSYADLSGRPVLGPVATSNLYSDLTDAPQQADYNLLTSTTTSLAIINRPTEVSAFNNDAGYYKADDSPMFGTITASGGISSGGNLSAIDGIFSGNLGATQLTLSSGAQVAFLNIPGSQVVNLGSDKTKAANAGMIGYEWTTTGFVDLYGAGTLVGSRGIKLWDNVTIPGTLATGGNHTVTGTMAVAGAASTGALTANSLSTTGSLDVVGPSAVGALTSTGTITAPALLVQSPQAAGVGAISVVNSTLGVNSVQSLTIGQSSSTNNLAEFKYNYASSGSASNNITLGLFGNSAPLTVFSNRVVTGPLTTNNLTVTDGATVSGNLSGGSVTATTGDLSAPSGSSGPGQGSSGVASTRCRT